MKQGLTQRLTTYLYNEKLAWALWFGLSLFAVWQSVRFNEVNNFLIYRYAYVHLLEHANLYTLYPQQNYEAYLYGPLFGLLIAPFCWLPLKAGIVAWVLFNVSFLLFAVYRLPIPRSWKAFVLLVSAHEAMTASSWLQINAFIGGCLLLGFAYTHQGRDGKALFFLMAAAFIKVLGVVGFAFWVFSKRPLRFFLWSLVWSAVFFALPLLAAPPSYLLQTYRQWAEALAAKSHKNDSLTDPAVRYQNVSVLGMVRRIFYLPNMNDLAVLFPAAALFASQYLPWRHYGDLRFRLYVLCSALLSTVLFSSGSESPTYVIAMPGLCLWYLLQPKTKGVNVFFFCVFFFTTFSYSDLLTPWFREHVAKPYSLKALPSFLVWLVIVVQIHQKQFLRAVVPFADDRKEGPRVA